MHLKFSSAEVISDSALGRRQIRVVANSGRRDRAGDRLVASGAKLDKYLLNPIVLADHNMSAPIGNFAPEIKDGAVQGVHHFRARGHFGKGRRILRPVQGRRHEVGFRRVQADRIRADQGRRRRLPLQVVGAHGIELCRRPLRRRRRRHGALDRLPKRRSDQRRRRGRPPKAHTGSRGFRPRRQLAVRQRSGQVPSRQFVAASSRDRLARRAIPGRNIWSVAIVQSKRNGRPQLSKIWGGALESPQKPDRILPQAHALR